MSEQVNWYDLPPRTIVKLHPENQRLLIKLLRTKYKKQREIAEKLNLDRHQIKLYETNQSNFSVKTLKDVSKLLQINMRDLEHHVIELGRKNKVKNPHLPFNFASPAGAALISIVNSEGHIPKHRGTTMHIRVNEIDMLEKSIEYAKNIFGEFKVEIKKTKGKNTHEIFFPSVISDSLEIAGLIRGSKSKKNPKIPKFIIENEELSRVYIGWSFACEMECTGKVVKLTRNIDISDTVPKKYFKLFDNGVIFKNKIPHQLMKITAKRKNNILENEADILRRFGIDKKTQIANLWKTKDNRITVARKIVISDKENMKKLLNIGIPLKERSERLVKIINSYKRDNILKIETYKRTVEKAREIQSKNGSFSRKELVDYYKQYTKWSDKKVDSHLRKLTNDRIIIKVSKGQYKFV